LEKQHWGEKTSDVNRSYIVSISDMSNTSGSSTTQAHHRLESVSIVGGFLDGATFDLAEGLNCIIGARGTGKTTVIEFVRYAMEAMPSEAAARKQVESLVESNLAGGRVEITVETKDGLSYIVSRSAGDKPVVLDENRSPTNISLRSGGLFKVDIYSQNEVEAIAQGRAEQARRCRTDGDEVVRRLTEIVRMSPAELAEHGGRLSDVVTALKHLGQHLGLFDRKPDYQNTVPNIVISLYKGDGEEQPAGA